MEEDPPVTLFEGDPLLLFLLEFRKGRLISRLYANIPFPCWSDQYASVSRARYIVTGSFITRPGVIFNWPYFRLRNKLFIVTIIYTRPGVRWKTRTIETSSTPGEWKHRCTCLFNCVSFRIEVHAWTIAFRGIEESCKNRCVFSLSKGINILGANWKDTEENRTYSSEIKILLTRRKVHCRIVAIRQF